MVDTYLRLKTERLSSRAVGLKKQAKVMGILVVTVRLLRPLSHSSEEKEGHPRKVESLPRCSRVSKNTFFRALINMN